MPKSATDKIVLGRDDVAWIRRDAMHLSAAAFHRWMVERYSRKCVVPSVGVVREVLAERGLVAPRPLPEGKRLKSRLPGSYEPNDVWCFEEVQPGIVALVDGFTGYVIRLDPLPGRQPRAWELELILRSAFAEHGMPEIIRVRPAPPFQTEHVQGLSRILVWLLRCHLVIDRRAQAPWPELGFTLPEGATGFAERLRAVDAFRKRYNETEIAGFQGSGVKYPGGVGTLLDLSEPYIADNRRTDDKGRLRWHKHRLDFGPELEKTDITFWVSEWRRFVEVRLKTLPLGMLDLERPERGMIAAPMLPRLSLEAPYLEVDWEPILRADLRRATSRRAGSP